MSIYLKISRNESVTFKELFSKIGMFKSYILITLLIGIQMEVIEINVCIYRNIYIIFSIVFRATYIQIFGLARIYADSIKSKIPKYIVNGVGLYHIH